MYSNGCCPGIFHTSGDFHHIHRCFIIKTDTHFHSHRLGNGAGNTAYDLFDQFRIFQKCGAFPVVYHLGDRASHIDIKNVKRTLLDTFCHLCHQIRLTAKKLHGYRMLPWIDLHQCLCILIVKRNCLGADHLHTDQSCSLLLAKSSKCQICNPGHRRKHKGIRDLHISDLPLHLHGSVLNCICFFLKFLVRDIS